MDQDRAKLLRSSALLLQLRDARYAEVVVHLLGQGGTGGGTAPAGRG
jgi:hypothetical protein